MYVDVREREKRLELIEFLEQEGFKVDYNGFRNKAWIVDSVLPIIVRFEDKTIDRIGNVTCAAALASSKSLHGGKIPGLEEFYQYYQKWKEEGGM